MTVPEHFSITVTVVHTELGVGEPAAQKKALEIVKELGSAGYHVTSWTLEAVAPEHREAFAKTIQDSAKNPKRLNPN